MTALKNVLFINPWIFDFTAYDFWMKPLGLLSIASLVRRTGRCRVSLVDCLDRFHPSINKPLKTKADGRGPFPKEEVEKPAILKDVPRRFSRYGISVPAFARELESVPHPDVVMLTCSMTYWYPGVQLAVERVRKRFPAVPIILGGAYATLCPTHAETRSGADIVVRGPGERSLFGHLRDILGDSFPPNPEPPPSFAELPPPDFGLLRDHRWLPLLTSRGCPYQCTFCASGLLSTGYERRPPEAVAAEVRRLAVRFRTRHFAFYDDALLVDKKRHFIPLLEKIRDIGIPLSFHTPNGLHIREIDQDLAMRFRRAGMTSLYLSLESADTDWIMEKSPKVSAAGLREALAALVSEGYRPSEINVYLIMGLAGQELRGVEESIRYVRSLGAVPRIALYSPIPGTREWAVLAERGTVADNEDPLLHNKVAFAYLRGGYRTEEGEAIRALLAEA